MGFMHAQDVWHRDHSESYPIPSSYETIGLDVQDDVKNKLYPLKIQLRQKPVVYSVQVVLFHYHTLKMAVKIE